MTTNRTDISTSADGGVIFAVDASGPFINQGHLSTTGDLASAIVVAVGGAVVTNNQTLSTTGDGSAGVLVGQLFGPGYDHVTVANRGTITVTGGFYDDGTTVAPAGGIEFAAGDHQTGVNYGTISAVEGIGLTGSDSLLLNYGTIEARGAGFYIEGLEARSTNNVAINKGLIHIGAESEAQWGIAFFSDHGVVRNEGTIRVDGFHDFGISIEGVGSHGENWGTILATADQGRGVLLNFYDNTFLNRGSILTTGQDSVGFRWAVGEVAFGTNGGVFTNDGAVTSAAWAVRGNEQVNTVVNHGRLTGAVDLGAANDVFVAGHGGQLVGALTLGEGDDLIVFERGGGSLTVSDFTAGAGDDAIDLSAFAFHAFSEVLSHASQVGADVVLSLGGHDQIVLQNVALGTLSADDFIFGH